MKRATQSAEVATRGADGANQNASAEFGGCGGKGQSLGIMSFFITVQKATAPKSAPVTKLRRVRGKDKSVFQLRSDESRIGVLLDLSWLFFTKIDRRKWVSSFLELLSPNLQ